MAREMKDSGVNWLPKIPSTWVVKPLKNLFTIGKGLSITKENLEEQGVPTVSYGQIHAKYNTGTKLDGRMFRYVNESYLKTNPNAIVSKGCFVFADTSEDLEGCGNCIYVDKDESFFAGYHTVTLFPKGGLENKYYAYLFKTDEWRSQIRAGLTEVKLYSVSQKVIRRTQIIVPPLKEQHRIVSFLDPKCAEIDKAIDATKASIEEYRKLRQVIITEAVTKGLNPDVEMKDSGIEWIGEVPKHWGITKLSNCYETTLGKMVETPIGTEDKWSNYLCAANIKWSGVDTSINKKMLFSENEKGLYLLQENDVLIMEGGSVGTTCIYNMEFYPCYIQNSVHRCRPRNGNDPRILYYWMTLVVASGYVDSVCNRATIMHYTKEKLSMTPICVIPYNEQKTIADCLDSKCFEIDSLIKSKEKLIEELTAYRKSLIYEYVTGKKEVPTV